MSYTRTLWRDGNTPAIDAAHLNNIEEGITNVDERVPEAPSVDGTYVLKAIVSNGETSYIWVLEE